MEHININSLKDIDKFFPEEKYALKYLAFIRWGEWARCPFCENKKSYFIENGKRYKCANSSCYKKYSVTTHSLLHGTNLEYVKILKAVYICSKSRGRYFVWDLEKEISVTNKTAFFIKERLDFAWEYVNRENKDFNQIFQSLIKEIFNQGHRYADFKQKKYGNHYYHIKDIDDISDHNQYAKLCNYAKMRMFFCEWIYINFADPEDIMADTFIYMHENNIKEYNADSIINLINRIIEKSWRVWVAAHPNVAERYRNRLIQWKRDARINLSPYYVRQLAKSSNKDIPMSEIRENVKLLKEKKEKIIKKRQEMNKMYDFISHFD